MGAGVPTLTGVKTATSTGTLLPNKFYCLGVEFFPSADGDHLVLTDKYGTEIYEVTGAGDASGGDDGYVCGKDFSCYVDGLVVDTISGGSVKVFVGVV